MLLSMTGFGEARSQTDGLSVAVEIRCINSRYLKASLRVTDGFGALEPQIEAVVRQRIRRGTVQVNVRIERRHSAADYRINAEVLDGYRHQLEALVRLWGLSESVAVERLLLLPGVAQESADASGAAAEHWPVVQETLEMALAHLDRMRAEEGRTMAADLRANCHVAAAGLVEIERRAPTVADAYRQRLQERLTNILAEHGMTLAAPDLIREIALYADRSDISEEIVRLRSHLEQFEATLNEPESAGRKLEFLTQEMVRETNTIGSKANDVEIARRVIEIKTVTERIREMIQNVE